MWLHRSAIAATSTAERPENLSQFATNSTNSSSNHMIKLGKILINKKLISPPQLDSVLNHQHHCHQRLGELLVKEKLISEEQLEQALREQYWRRNGYWVI